MEPTIETTPDRQTRGPRRPSCAAGQTGKWLVVVPIALAFLLVGLSGCVFWGDEEETDPEVEEDTRPTVEAISQCFGTYPKTEVPVRCENEVREIVAEKGFALDGGWTCIAQGDSSSGRSLARLYWNVSAQAFALHYTARGSGPAVSGILAFRDENGTAPTDWSNASVQHENGTDPTDWSNASVQRENGTAPINWNDASRNATLHLPSLPHEGELRFFAFTTSHDSTHPRLQGGTFHVNWSMHEEAPYPVRILENDNGQFYFPHAIPEPDDEIIPWTFSEFMTQQGKDFGVTVIHDELLDLSLSYDADATASC